jgi:peroxiredoxin
MSNALSPEIQELPIRNVELHDGRRIALQSVCESKPAALVFLRHLGCVFCREHVADLRASSDLNLYLVVLADCAEASRFREEEHLDFNLICEPDGDLFREFGLQEISLVKLITPHVLMRAAQAARRGIHQGPQGRLHLMLGGSFVVAVGGRIVWSHRAVDVADNASPQDIERALAAANEARD